MAKVMQLSNLQRVGDYDARTRTFTVEFVARPGVTYVVGPVGRDVHAGLMRASSPGSYFHAKVKSAGVPVARVAQS